MTVNRTVIASATNDGQQDPAEVQALLDRADGKPAAEPAVAAAVVETSFASYKTEEEVLAAFRAQQAAAPAAVVQTPEEIAAAAAAAELAAKPAVGDLELDPDAAVDDTAIADVTDALEAAGLDSDKYTASFLESGTLKDEEFAELAKKGYTRQTVDTYLAGLQVLQERAKTDTLAAAGGEENYRAMQQWASANVVEADKVAFNAALRNPDTAKRTEAIAGMYAKYTAANGKESVLVTGGKPPSNVPADTFTSMAQVRVAMADKRYGKDSAYTKDIERRMLHANI